MLEVAIRFSDLGALGGDNMALTKTKTIILCIFAKYSSRFVFPGNVRFQTNLATMFFGPLGHDVNLALVG